MKTETEDRRPKTVASGRSRVLFATLAFTVSGLRYPVSGFSQCPDGSPPPCRSADRAPANSVAVLYFENASRDTADAYLADGLTEDIITRLSGIERLTVRSRYQVRRYRGTTSFDPSAVGRALGVSYLVSGTLRRSGNELRVNAELIRVAGGVQVWGRQFDQAAGNVFAIQEALSGEVARGIVGRLLPGEQRTVAAQPTRNAAAYDHYLRGNFYLAQRDSAGYARALDEYAAAFRADSTFADAVARLAMTYNMGAGAIPLPLDTLRARAETAAARALRLSPRSAEAWLATAQARLLREPRRMTGVREALDSAMRLDSGNAEIVHAAAVNAMYRGDVDLSTRLYHRALALEPNRPVALNNLGAAALRAGDYGQARAWFDSLEHVDQRYAPGRWRPYRVAAMMLMGDTAAARAETAAWPSIPGMGPLAAYVAAFATIPRGDTIALRRAVMNYLASVRAVDDNGGRLGWGMVPAWIIVARGDLPSLALDVLEAQLPTASMHSTLTSRAFDSLRSDPRFQRLWAATAP
jgi:TolB-like protein